MADVYVPKTTLRRRLREAKEAFEGNASPDNAIALQKAQDAFDAFFRRERASFAVIEGDKIVG